MKTLFKYLTYSFAIIIGFTACDGLNSGFDSGILDTETEDFAKALESDLSMSDEQTLALKEILESYANEQRSPGFIWRVAAGLQDTLDDAQKNYLFLQADTAKTMHLVRVMIGPMPGIGNGRGEGSMNNDKPVAFVPRPLRELLSEEQIDSIKAIHEQYKPDFESAFESFKAGETTPAAFVDAIIELKATVKNAVVAVLTEEQLSAWATFDEERLAERAARFEEMEARRAEMIALSKEVRDEVLAIDAETSATLDELVIAEKTEQRALITSFKNGEITSTEVFDTVFANEATFYSDLETLLEADQIEIIKLHDALAARKGPGKKKGRRSPNGGGQGGSGNGPGH